MGMGDGDKKPKGELVVALGLGKGKPSAKDDPDADADMDSTAKDDAAGALLDAIDAKDRDGITDAFETMMKLCMPAKYDGGSEEESE